MIVSAAVPAVILIVFFFVRGKATNAYVSKLLHDRGLNDLSLTFLKKEVRSKKYRDTIEKSRVGAYRAIAEWEAESLSDKEE